VDAALPTLEARERPTLKLGEAFSLFLPLPNGDHDGSRGLGSWISELAKSRTRLEMDLAPASCSPDCGGSGNDEK
jgi:hypothetical protein